MKKILALVTMVLISISLLAGIPHPVFVEYDGNPVSFSAYLGNDTETVLTENAVGCGIVSDYNLIMVECGNFPVWEYADVLYIVLTNDDNSTQWIDVTLEYDNVQAIMDVIWYEGTPGGAVTTQNEFATGWNLWSHNVALENDSVNVVFESLENLSKVKSITQSYDPDLEPQFNTLHSIIDGYGYWVQVSETETLEFVDAAPLDRESVLIDLIAG